MERQRQIFEIQDPEISEILTSNLQYNYLDLIKQGYHMSFMRELSLIYQGQRNDRLCVPLTSHCRNRRVTGLAIECAKPHSRCG